MAGSSDFRLCAQQKHKPHLSPHYRGVGQEYLQCLSYLCLGEVTTKLLQSEGGLVTKLLQLFAFVQARRIMTRCEIAELL